METFWPYLCLGLVQGVTEFIPVSSSAHLVFVQSFLMFPGSAVLLDVVLHLGTLVAVVVYMRRDLIKTWEELVWLQRSTTRGTLRWWRMPRLRVGMLSCIAVIPTAIIGLTFNDFFERSFEDVTFAGATLFLTGLILWWTRWARVGRLGARTLRPWHAWLVGTAQGISIIPGISRSGATIATCLALGFRRPFAAQFSFLLSIPAILAAAVLEARHLKSGVTLEFGAGLAIGFVAAACTGWASLWLLDRMVRGARLHLFAWYCWIAGPMMMWLGGR